MSESGGPWAPLPAGDLHLPCGHLHGSGAGRLDESARRLPHEELAVALMLVAEGHQVRSLGESRRGGRRPDLSACVTEVEIKSFLPAAERDRPPSPFGVYNKLTQAAGQAQCVVVTGAGSGLTAATARRGLARFLSAQPDSPLGWVRITGDGFDLAWARRPGIGLDPVRAALPTPLPPPLPAFAARPVPVAAPGRRFERGPLGLSGL